MRHAIAACAALLLLSALVLGPSASIAAKEGELPTKITSERMTYETEGSTVVFEKNVVVERPDFTLKADKLKVSLEKGRKGEGSAELAAASGIEKIVATGNVIIRRDKGEGRCGKATYFVKEGIILLEENPVLTEGKNRIQGEQIKLWLKENRSEVLGGQSKPVEMIFSTPPSGAGGN